MAVGKQPNTAIRSLTVPLSGRTRMKSSYFIKYLTDPYGKKTLHNSKIKIGVSGERVALKCLYNGSMYPVAL